MIKNENVRRIYRIVLVIVALIATVTSVTDRITAIGGDGRPVALFFTAWSVWLCLLSAVVSLIYDFKGKNDSRVPLLLKFCANIMIIATFIVSAFVLPAKIWTASYWQFGSVMKHFLVPILTVLDSVIFDPGQHMDVSYPFKGVVLPLLYWIVIVLRIVIFRNSQGGAIPENLWDAYYPYGFTNFDNGHSLGGLIGLLAGILVGLIAIGFVYYLVDKKRKK